MNLFDGRLTNRVTPPECPHRDEPSDAARQDALRRAGATGILPDPEVSDGVKTGEGSSND